LNRDQIARANACQGLSMFLCFEGWTQDTLSREQFLAVREKQCEAFRLALSGYHVKEFLAEGIGTETLQWMLEAGARMLRDYSHYLRKSRMLTLKSPRRPWLVGLTKQEAFAHPGSNIAGLFIYTAPRFHFNHSQQLLLQHALMGETSENLAAALSL